MASLPPVIQYPTEVIADLWNFYRENHNSMTEFLAKAARINAYFTQHKSEIENTRYIEPTLKALRGLSGQLIREKEELIYCLYARITLKMLHAARIADESTKQLREAQLVETKQHDEVLEKYKAAECICNGEKPRDPKLKAKMRMIKDNKNNSPFKKRQERLDHGSFQVCIQHLEDFDKILTERLSNENSWCVIS